MAKKTKRRKGSRSRWFARKTTCVAALVFAILCGAGDWFSHHHYTWIRERQNAWYGPAANVLLYLGDRTGLVTDALGWTGHDAVYDYDEPAPIGRVFFAGAPLRRAQPAPNDIRILDRGEFVVGYSPSLARPVWAAYHIPAEAAFPVAERPPFRADSALPDSPAASAYKGSGYDRGHMVPNHAIVTRFGTEAQKKTFLMTNIAPQPPALNRGPWREVEALAADLWTARYGELWILVGGITSRNPERIGTDPAVDVPDRFWTVLIAQNEEGVRALALVFPKNIPYSAFPVHNITTIDHIESLTGLELFPDLPSFIKRPLASDLPTRLWPVRPLDLFARIGIRFPGY